jgi:fibronectin type 3 domain-containing protein
LSVTDNVTGSPQTVALAGTATHDVILTWSASPGAAGYDIYRGSSSGGESSTPLNSAPVTGPSYTDTTVQAGQTYYYKITAVAANGSTQSGSSSEASVTVPSP